MVEDTCDEYERPTEAESERAVGRRRFLQLTGAAAAGVAGVASQTGTARAATAGYGTGGYGVGPYGGPEEVAVESKYVSYTSDSAAALCGAVLDFGGARYAQCYFEWRAAGDDEWERSWGETRVRPGVFSARITGLDSDTTYEFRAVAAVSGDGKGTGDIAAFRTSQ